MRKILMIITMLMLLFSFTSCAKFKSENPDNLGTNTETPDLNTPEPTITETVIAEEPKPDIEDTVSTLTISDYYPFRENVNYIYEGYGNEYASYQVTTDYITKDRIQLRSNNGGSELVKVIEKKDGQLKMVLYRGECYYREDLTKKAEENSEILLKEPLVEGTKWTLNDNRERYISNVDVSIDTPAGNFKSIEVTTEGKDDKIIDYYALDMGLVKSVYQSGEMEVTSSLAEIKEDVAFVQTMRIYYPNIEKDEIAYEERPLTFRTNDITRTVIENTIKDLISDDLQPILTPNMKMNSLYLNKDNIVYVDFSKELISEMNKGSEYELMTIQSITNTLGAYYGVENVYITVENKPYESGHIAKRKGETFQVDIEY